MNPKDVTYFTDLQGNFTKDLLNVKSDEDFNSFLSKWNYWLDEETKDLTGKDWEWLRPLIDDCRKDSNVLLEEKHEPTMALLMPERILKISIVATQYEIPWDCAYLRMKEQGAIDY